MTEMHVTSSGSVVRVRARRPRRAGVVAAALVVVALVAVGCSSSTTSGSTNTIRIGLEGPLSGSQADTGTGMLRGAQLAAEELNAKGGINGRTVEIVAIDDKADPDAGVSAAQSAVKNGLDAVVGPYNSGVGLETLPIYIGAGLTPLRLTSADSTAGLGFTLQPMTSQIAPVATDAIVRWARATSVALIVDDTQSYTKDAAAAMATTLPAAGVTVTTTVTIVPGESNYDAAITKALASNPQLVYIVAYYPEAGLIAKGMAATRATAKCMADYGAYDNSYPKVAGAAAAAACPVVGVPAPGDFPDSAGHVAAFTAKFSSPPGAWSPYTYDSVMLLADAIGRAGGTASNQLASALRATKGWRGWTGTVSFETPSGNRIPAPVTVDVSDADGVLHVDRSWATAVGFTY